jgi:thiamine pyrophosphate-dependent acetolactate synthase large subunit-like protein
VDGGFTMLMGEVATLVKYRLPVKILVIKNSLLGEIKSEQPAMEGNPEYRVELEPSILRSTPRRAAPRDFGSTIQSGGAADEGGF